jgi:hypothetical protein
MGSYNIPTPAVIFDIDGTLANCNHRRHFVDGTDGAKNFDAFYDAMALDTINEKIRGMCNIYFMNDWHIIICTGRPEKYRAITTQWLKRYGVFYKELMMRPDERRFEPDYLVKQDMLTNIRFNREVHFCVDDRRQVVDMYRRNGCLVLQCDYGEF